MKKIALFAIIALTAGCIDATAQNKKEMKKVLFVLTSHSELGDTGEKTGFWTEEFAAPYYELADKGVSIDIATPKGGQPPIDPKSEDPSAATEDTKRFDKDTELKAKLKETHKLADVKESDYDAVFYPGGHGPLWDLATDKNSIALIAAFYTNDKPVAFVCHSPAALNNVKVNGEFLVKGKKLTGFSNTEEAAVG
jgi:putative intracellular protease/amidase